MLPLQSGSCMLQSAAQRRCCLLDDPDAAAGSDVAAKGTYCVCGKAA